MHTGLLTLDASYTLAREQHDYSASFDRCIEISCLFSLRKFVEPLEFIILWTFCLFAVENWTSCESQADVNILCLLNIAQRINFNAANIQHNYLHVDVMQVWIHKVTTPLRFAEIMFGNLVHIVRREGYLEKQYQFNDAEGNHSSTKVE